MSLRKTHLLATLLAATLLVRSPSASAQPSSHLAAEAGLQLVWGEHLGRAPLVLAGASLELAAGRAFAISLGGLAAVASPSALPFFEQTSVGGGADLALRYYLRGGWPRGFAVGAAASLLVVDGVAITSPRVELIYRFILFSHLALRLHAGVGGLILWDTAPDDQRPGPAARSEEYIGNKITGFWIGLGLSVGWAGHGRSR